MRFCSLLLLFLSVTIAQAALPALPDGLVYARDGSGVFGYKNTPKLPWCDYLVHDPDRPAPKRVDPGPAPAPAPIPADAIILFDGKNLSQWLPNQWEAKEGEIVVYGSGQPEIPVPFAPAIMRNVTLAFFIVYHLSAADRARYDHGTLSYRGERCGT